MANVTLILQSNRTEYGTVNSNEINPSGYEPPQSLVIKAVPKSGCSFSHWSDGDTHATRTYRLMKDTILTAYFYLNKNTAVSVATPIQNLLNKAGLDRFWLKLKEWLANRTTEAKSGASRIGHYNDSNFFKRITGSGISSWEESQEVSTNLEDTLKDVAFRLNKMSNLLAATISNISDNYCRQLTVGLTIFPQGDSWKKVSDDDVYDNGQTYYYGQGGQVVAFGDTNCAQETYDPRVKYYIKESDPISGTSYRLWTPSDSATASEQFEEMKADLYFINNWYRYVVTDDNLYIKIQGGSEIVAEHSGIINVLFGYNSGARIKDVTLGIELFRTSHRDKYGQGVLTATAPIIKGHTISWDCYTQDRGWEKAIVFYFSKGA